MTGTQHVLGAGLGHALGQPPAIQRSGDITDTMASKTSQGSPFPAQAELDAAIAHFRGGSVGAPEKYVRPFTRQLKSDTALRFPADKAYFDRADAVQAQHSLGVGLLGQHTPQVGHGLGDKTAPAPVKHIKPRDFHLCRVHHDVAFLRDQRHPALHVLAPVHIG